MIRSASNASNSMENISHANLWVGPNGLAANTNNASPQIRVVCTIALPHRWYA